VLTGAFASLIEVIEKAPSEWEGQSGAVASLIMAIGEAPSEDEVLAGAMASLGWFGALGAEASLESVGRLRVGPGAGASLVDSVRI